MVNWVLVLRNLPTRVCSCASITSTASALHSGKRVGVGYETKRVSDR